MGVCYRGACRWVSRREVMQMHPQHLQLRKLAAAAAAVAVAAAMVVYPPPQLYERVAAAVVAVAMVL